MAKEPQELKWIENLLPEDFRRRPMFGGFIYYVDEKGMLLIFESAGGSRTYKGKKYDFDLWNGCMFPVDREHHEKALKQFPFLIPHPILSKWLYLPLHTENFDDLVSEVLEAALRPNSYWGSIPEKKSTGKKKSLSDKTLEKISVRMDTRRPRMFSDEPVEDVLEKAQKISDLKNLGEVTERAFHRAGIKTAQQFIKLGWKKTMLKLIEKDPKARHSLFAYALIGALKNQEFSRISNEDKDEARQFIRGLIDAEKAKKKAAAKKARLVKK